MDSNKDAYGHTYWNYMKGLTSFSVVERSDGYVNVDAGFKEAFATYKDWDRHDKDAIKHANGRVLDIGCGAGRVGRYMQEKGQPYFGIDNSPLSIRVCKQRGVKDVKIMPIEGIGSFKEGTFGSVVMLGNNFGLFGSLEKARRLLKQMYRITTATGLIVTETRDPYITDNPVHFRYHKENIKKGRMGGQLKLRIRFMQYSTDWFDYLYVSRDEMRELLEGTGWRVKKFFLSRNYRTDGEYAAVIVKDGR